MSHPLLHCRFCGKRKPRLTEERAENYFLYCSQECKDTHEEQRLQKRLEQMKTHNPEDRREKTEGELRAMGAISRPRPTVTEETPRKVAERQPRKKGTRSCSKCGQTGHNARTCGRKRLGLRKPEEKAPEPRFVVGGDAPAPRKSKPNTGRKKAASKKRQYKCKKCGGVGHNSRTCKG